MELEQGIDYWAAVGKYRVRVTRRRVSYKIGLFDKYEDAVDAKNKFLSDYELTAEDSEAVPMYSKEWFKRERKKQIEAFTSSYKTPTGAKPKMILVLKDDQLLEDII